MDPLPLDCISRYLIFLPVSDSTVFSVEKSLTSTIHSIKSVDVHPAESRVAPEYVKVYRCRLPQQSGGKIRLESAGNGVNLSKRRFGPDDHTGATLAGDKIHYFSTTSSGGIIDVIGKYHCIRPSSEYMNQASYSYHLVSGGKQLDLPQTYQLEPRTLLGPTTVLGSKLYALGKSDGMLSLYELHSGKLLTC